MILQAKTVFPEIICNTLTHIRHNVFYLYKCI